MMNMRVSKQQFRKLMIGIIVVVVAGCLVSAVSFWQQRMNQRMPVNVTVAPINMVNKPLRVERTGTAVYAARVPVYSEGAGQVTDVYVTSGQAVKAGQPLVKLEITGGEAAAAPGAQTSEGSASKAIYENALKEYNRYQKLYEIGGIARKQLDASAARLQEAQAGLEQGAQAPGAVVNGPVTIQAPIDGTITGSVIAAGSAISSGQELLALGSGQEVEVVLPLEQSELYFVQLGSPAVIKVGSEQLAGQVSSIYPEVKDKQVAAFMAQIKLLQPPGNGLTPGAAATVSIATGQETAVAAVPAQALLRDAEGNYSVFLAAEGKAVSQQVTLGEGMGELVEITTALPLESKVIISNVDHLKNGDSITVSE
jgi:RND family efflux transporter MFP subunit